MKTGLMNKKKGERKPKKGVRMSVLVKLLCCILIPLVLILSSFGIILNASTSRDVNKLQNENLQLGCSYSAA